MPIHVDSARMLVSTGTQYGGLVKDNVLRVCPRSGSFQSTGRKSECEAAGTSSYSQREGARLLNAQILATLLLS
jgi:hypothetical protein